MSHTVYTLAPMTLNAIGVIALEAKAQILHLEERLHGLLVKAEKIKAVQQKASRLSSAVVFSIATRDLEAVMEDIADVQATLAVYKEMEMAVEHRTAVTKL